MCMQVYHVNHVGDRVGHRNIYSFQEQLVKADGERLKAIVHDFQKRLTNQVEGYNSKLMFKKDELEEAQLKLQRFRRDSHVTELITKQEKLTKKVKKLLRCNISEPLSKLTLITGSKSHN